MLRNLVASLALIAVSSSAFAGILSTTPGSRTIEDVKIAQEGKVTIENQDIPVSIIGAGLRKKKVAIAQVKVYIAELLSSDASKFVRTESEALASLDQSRTIALRMNFVRGVDAATVQTSFSEGFAANSISVADSSVSAFLSAVRNGGDAVSGKALTVVAQKNADKSETIYYEDSNGKVTSIQGAEGFSKKVLSLWLGKGADAGVDALRQQIISGQ